MIKQYIFVVLLSTCCQQAMTQLAINGIMQPNADCIIDDLNEFLNSWGKLYNEGLNTDRHGEYRLGLRLSQNIAEAWIFPIMIIDHKLCYTDVVNRLFRYGRRA